MNDDLISRSAAIEKIKPYGTLNGSALGYHSGAVDCAIIEIERLPAVDAVEVVRCYDCKFWDYGDCYRLELSRPTDFCSYGERKENG